MHFECNNRAHAFHLEKTIHHILKGQRLFGEWFKVNRGNLMKMLNNMGSKEEIESIVQEMDLYDRHGNQTSGSMVAKLKRTVESRDREIEELKRAVQTGKERRKLYADELIKRGMEHREFIALRKIARDNTV